MIWLRDAFRLLRRAPGYSALTIATLAIALGIGTAVFASVAAIRWPVSPFRDGDALFEVYGMGNGVREDIRSVDRLRSVERSVPILAGLELAQRDRAFVETSRTRAERMTLRVGHGLFELLGAKPAAGRFFAAVDTNRSDANLAVVSDAFWRRDLEGAALTSGLSVSVDGSPYAVIGVAPPRLGGADLWLLAPPGWFERSTVATSIHGYVRARSGVTREQLQADLRSVAQRLDETHGRGRSAFRFSVSPLELSALPLSELHIALVLAAIAILVTACANVANLALSRARAREPIYALQRALGATRWRIARDVLAECVMLSLAAGLLGALVVFSCVGVIRRMIPVDVPLLGALDVQVDWLMFVFTFGASLVAAAACALVPALRASNADLATPLKESSGTTTARRGWRHSAFVAVEVAIALGMVTSSALLLRASRRVESIDFGYDRRGLLQAQVYLPRTADTTDEARLIASVRDGIDGLADVQAVTWSAPARDAGLSVRGATSAGNRTVLFNASVRSVGANYLATLGIPLVSGRDLLDGDAEGPGVAVIDERVALELWPHEEAVGRQLLLPRRGRDDLWLRVVGVAKRVRGRTSTLDAFDTGPAQIYVSTPPFRGVRDFVVRTGAGREANTLSQLGALLRDLAPPGTYTYVSSYRDETTRLADAHRFLSGTFTFLALCALGLSVVGLFSVLTYAVASRTREYTVRMVLGESPRSILLRVVRNAAVLVLSGTAAGAFFAFAIARFVDPFLFDLYRIDATTLIVAEAIVLACSAAACVVPAVRAARVTPQEMLRAA